MAGFTHPRVGTYGRKRGGSGSGFTLGPSRPKPERDDDYEFGAVDPRSVDPGKERYLNERMQTGQERQLMLQKAGEGYAQLDPAEKKRLAEGRSPGALDATRGQGYRGMGKPSGLISGTGDPMPTLAQRNAAAAEKEFPQLGQTARPEYYGKIGQTSVLPVPAAVETEPGQVGQPGVRVVPVNPLRGGGVVTAMEMHPDTPSSTRGAAGEFVGPDEAGRRARVADRQLQAQRMADARGNLNAANGSAMAPTAMSMRQPEAPLPEPAGRPASEFPTLSTPALDALRNGPTEPTAPSEPPSAAFKAGSVVKSAAELGRDASLLPGKAAAAAAKSTYNAGVAGAEALASGAIAAERAVTPAVKDFWAGLTGGKPAARDTDAFSGVLGPAEKGPGAMPRPADPSKQTGAQIDRDEERRRQASYGGPSGFDA